MVFYAGVMQSFKGMYIVTTDTHLEDELAHILSHMKASVGLSTMSCFTKTFLSLFLDGTEPGVLEIAFEDSKFCFGHKKTSMLKTTVKKLGYQLISKCGSTI